METQLVDRSFEKEQKKKLYAQATITQNGVELTYFPICFPGPTGLTIISEFVLSQRSEKSEKKWIKMTREKKNHH